VPEEAPPPNVIDLSLKELARCVPDALFRFLGVEARREQIRIVDPGVIVKELEADSVLLYSGDGGEPEWGLHLEYQFQPDRRELRRWALKALSLSEHLNLDILLVVLYLRKGSRASFPREYRAGGAITNRFEFETVCLWEEAERIRGGDVPELAPLLVLCEDGPPEAVLVEERDLIREAGFPAPIERELLALAYVLGIRYATRRVLDAVFGKELPMLKDAGIISEWIEEAQAEGRAEGRAERQPEIRSEGRVEGIRHLLRVFLTNRFGRVPDALSARIDSETAEWCEELSRRAFEVETLEELGY
jgi:hypothetical protein